MSSHTVHLILSPCSCWACCCLPFLTWLLGGMQPGYDAVMCLKLPGKASSLQVPPDGEGMGADTHKAAWRAVGDSGQDEKNKWEMEREAELMTQSKSAYYLIKVGYSQLAFVTAPRFTQTVSPEIYNPQTMNSPRTSLSWVTVMTVVRTRHITSE